MPGYKEALERGDVVQGEVIRVEEIKNVTINKRHPRRVVFSYGEGKEASMAMALDESARKGQALTVRLLGEHAYPEGVRPLARPSWLNLVLVGAALLGTLFLGFGILRLLVIAGALFAGGRALMKEK